MMKLLFEEDFVVLCYYLNWCISCSFFRFKVIGRGACEQKDSSSIEMEGDISVNGDPNINNNHDSKKRDDKDEPAKTVPLYKLFSFADPLDNLLMFLGTVGAIGNGVSIPLTILMFGNMINAFGGTENSNVVDEVSKVIPH